MGQTTITIEGPEYVQTKTVDSNGRLYIGKDYAGKEVRVIIEELSDNPESGSDDEQDSNPSEDTQSDSEGSNSDTHTDNEDSEDKEGDDASWLQDGEDSE